jgi:hypothetical protein
MAVITGSILSTVISGTRIQNSQSINSILVKKQSGTVERINGLVSYGAIAHNTKIGTRKFTIASLKSIPRYGFVISTVGLESNRKYGILPSVLIGKRIRWIKGENTLQGNAKYTTRPSKTFTGISTIGIQYQPPTSMPAPEKKVRRWPRDWHGENMA